MDTMTLFRRIRIDSKEDVIMLVVIAVVYIGLYFLLKKFAPNLSDKTAQWISGGVAIVAALICVFCIL